mgnify:CR=1 FL=1|jgi:hypothetical protein
MARVKQFAKDMGMSYNQANNLVKKGRALKDGGSSVLESTMNKAKVIKASNGKIVKDPEERSKMKAKTSRFKDVVKKSTDGKITPKEAMGAIKKIILKSDGGGFPDLSGDGKTTMKDVLIGRGVVPKPKTMKAKKGAIVKMRGGGLAIQGTKFSGLY